MKYPILVITFPLATANVPSISATPATKEHIIKIEILAILIQHLQSSIKQLEFWTQQPIL